MAKSEQTFNPRSNAVVLAYQGDEAWAPALNGIPARDLTEADICRLVYMTAVNAYDGEPGGPPMPDPEKPGQAQARALVELLLDRKVDGRAVYAKPKPARHQDSSTESPTPAEPADKPEA